MTLRLCGEAWNHRPVSVQFVKVETRSFLAGGPGVEAAWLKP